MSEIAERVAEGVDALALRTPTLPPATATNSYLVGSKGAFYVVEPATPHARERQLLFEQIRRRAATGEKLLGAVVSHHHRDHVGAAQAFRTEFGAPLFAHPVTKARLAGLVTVDRTIEDGDLLLEAVRVLHTPGHAPGHVCLHHESDGWLIAGDMVASVGTIVVDPDDGGDMAAYIEQLMRLARLPLRRVLPAHGAPVDDPQGLFAFYLSHRAAREDKILTAVMASAAGQDLGAIVRLAYADTPTLLWPLASKSARAHLAKLEQERRIERQGTRWIAGPGEPSERHLA